MSQDDPATAGQDTPERAVATRRRVISGVGAAAIVGLAGCLGTEDGGGDSDDETEDETEEIDPQLQLDGTTLTDSFPIQLEDATSGDVVGEVHWHGDEFSHWHFQPLAVPLEEWRNVRAKFLNRDLEPIPLGEDEQYRLEMTRTEDTPKELVDVDITGNLVNLFGASAGTGQVLFHLVTDEERVLSSPLLEVEVAGSDDEESA